MKSSERKKMIAGIILGASVGAFIGFLLSCDKGRNMVRKMKKLPGMAADELEKFANPIDDKEIHVDTPLEHIP
ncbi:hypothetical protein COR50_14875 [Chitinophaga caeni]|uniref:YtxH domain-containing protein n=1 Tax=Chitinophaga caeni TaxID=2029983 RepID=A0A291QWW1_9BACT|nr:YtxH domain-containing protein [Chitinophaga caeni]ATL48344.1 hypothetical protein COR50_14875 [Chitinophaga caeni]